MSEYNGKERREDRRAARHQKHEDIKDGESRKEAREDKHAMKKADREKWDGEGHGISDDVSTWASDVADNTLGLVSELLGPAAPAILASPNPEAENPEDNSNSNS